MMVDSMDDCVAKVHDFRESLAFSKMIEDQHIFDNYYKYIFDTNLLDIYFHDDLETQKRGIDKTLLFKDGYRITIDEKFDRYSHTGNFFIELMTDVARGKKGWLYKNECDYVVYGFADGAVSWIPMVVLRDLWFYHQHDDGHDWMTDGTVKFIRNKGYNGMGVLVPRDRLEWEIGQRVNTENTPSWDRICYCRKGWLYYKDGQPREVRYDPNERFGSNG